MEGEEVTHSLTDIPLPSSRDLRRSETLSDQQN